MKKWQSISRVFSKVETALAWIGGLGIMFTMFYVAIDVLARFLFKTSIGGGTEQLVSMITVLVGYAPLAYTMAGNGHVTMTAVTDHLHGRAKLLNAMWVSLFCAAFCLLMLYVTGKAGFLRAYSTKEIVDALFPFKLYIWYGKLGQPIGLCAVTLTSVIMFIHSLLAIIFYQGESGAAGADGGCAENGTEEQ